MIADLLIGLAKANVAAAAAVLLALALRRPMRAAFGARAAYALWLAPPAAGLAVLLAHPARETAISPIILTATTMTEALVAQAPRAAPDLAVPLLALWLLGVALAAGFVLLRQAAFVAAMGRLEPLPAGAFRAEHAGVGPAVVGVLRPKIVAPADFDVRFEARERALILAHEGAHLKGGDTAINAAACALQCLCWFNPLIHLGVRALRVDQELACDAAVIGRFPGQRRLYAELLLKTQMVTHPLPLGCHWPAGSEHPLKERIVMLKGPMPGRMRRAAGLAAVTLVSLGGAAAAWAAQPIAGFGPGAAQRAEALAQLAAHPTYSCDPELERKGIGCKIIPLSPWVAVPTAADVARAYPPQAREAGQAAQVQVACKTTPKGMLEDCQALDTQVRSPNGQAVSEATKAAFGKAALQLTRYYQERQPGPPNPAREGMASFRIAIGEFGPGVPTSKGLPTPPQSRPQAQAGAPPVIRQPDWINKPTGADIARLYPPEAVKQHFEGRSTLACGVDKDGRLTGCVAQGIMTFGAPDAIREDFRKATLELAGLFRMRPQTVDGMPTANGRVIIPIRWMLPVDPAAKARLDALTG